jgi:LysR family glycine cleavage system transcriptional activator
MSLTDPDRLPPLTALRAFEAAARRMSFAQAAEELHVTPAALSYQIKQLEAHFGTPLFRRLNRAVELTEAGRALQPGAAEGFEAFRRAQAAVRRLSRDRPLVVTAGPAFTAKWLAPRLFRFAEAHPDIELRFVASLRLLDFERDEVDAAVRFGPGHDEGGLFSRRLWTDWVLPLCAPERAAGLARPADLAGHPLLHDDSLGAFPGAPDWADWIAAAGGASGRDPGRGPRFSNADHALDAAADNAGVVLGRLLLAERDLAAGRLVAPFGRALPVGAEYRFVCPAGAERSPRLAAFLEWLEAGMAASRAALAPWLPPGEGDFTELT